MSLSIEAIVKNGDKTKLERELKAGRRPAGNISFIPNGQILSVLLKYDIPIDTKYIDSSKFFSSMKSKFIEFYTDKFYKTFPNLNIPSNYIKYLSECCKVKLLTLAGKGDSSLQTLIDFKKPFPFTINELNEALRIAVTKNQINTSRILINEGANPDQFIDGHSLIDIAVENRNPFLVELLGGDPNKINANQNNSGKYSNLQGRDLLKASATGDLDLVAMCLHKGIDPNYISGDRTPLMMAIENNVIGIIDSLINAGANITLHNSRGETPISIAVHHCDDDVTLNLLERYDSSISLPEKNQLALEAIEAGRYKVLRYLVGHGAIITNLSLRSPSREIQEYMGRYKSLLEQIVLKSGKGKPAEVQQLIDEGAPVNGSSDEGYIALGEAAHFGKERTIRILLEHGADPNARNWKDQTPLISCCMNAMVKCARMLIDAGADINAHSHKQSVLQAAAFGGGLECVELIFEKGAEIGNQKYQLGSIEVAEFFLKRGAIIDGYFLLRSNKKKQDVLDYLTHLLTEACENNDPERVTMLLDQNVPGELISEYDNPLLSAANFCGDAVEPLVRIGKAVVTPEVVVTSALRGFASAVRFLVTTSERANMRNEAGMTVLEAAARSGSIECVSIVLKKGGRGSNLISHSRAIADHILKAGMKCALVPRERTAVPLPPKSSYVKPSTYVPPRTMSVPHQEPVYREEIPRAQSVSVVPPPMSSKHRDDEYEEDDSYSSEFEESEPHDGKPEVPPPTAEYEEEEEDLTEELHEAVRRGDTVETQRLLRDGVVVGVEPYTFGSKEVYDIIIGYIIGEYKQAAERCNAEAVEKLLISRSFDPSSFLTPGRSTALHLAVRSQSPPTAKLETVRVLMNFGLSPIQPDETGTPVTDAARTGDGNLVAQLLAVPLPPGFVDPRGCTLVMAAAESGNAQLVTWVLQIGLNYGWQGVRPPNAEVANVMQQYFVFMQQQQMAAPQSEGQKKRKKVKHSRGSSERRQQTGAEPAQVEMPQLSPDILQMFGNGQRGGLFGHPSESR